MKMHSTLIALATLLLAAFAPSIAHTSTRTQSMCAEAQLEKECTDWALKQEDHSRVRYDRWMRAESIDDIKYVIRQVRGD